MANKHRRSLITKRMMKRREHRQSLAAGTCLLALALLAGALVTYVVFRTPTVFVEYPSERVVRVEDGRGSEINPSQWEKILAGQYDRILVGENFNVR